MRRISRRRGCRAPEVPDLFFGEHTGHGLCLQRAPGPLELEVASVCRFELHITKFDSFFSRVHLSSPRPNGTRRTSLVRAEVTVSVPFQRVSDVSVCHLS